MRLWGLGTENYHIRSIVYSVFVEFEVDQEHGPWTNIVANQAPFIRREMTHRALLRAALPEGNSNFTA